MTFAEFEAFLCRLNRVERIEDLRPEARTYWRAFFRQLYVYSCVVSDTMGWLLMAQLKADLPKLKFDPPRDRSGMLSPDGTYFSDNALGLDLSDLDGLIAPMEGFTDGQP